MFMNSVIDLTAYHNEYLGKRHLKDELGVRFPQSHSFLYRGDVFLFLHGKTLPPRWRLPSPF